MGREAAEVHERIDLHEKLSHAILPFSNCGCARRCPPAGGRCIISKSQRGRGNRFSGAVAEARSLHAIDAALKDLDGHFHTLHYAIALQKDQQSVAIARLQQSCIKLSTRLADYRWRRHQVIEETLAFLGEVLDKARFATPADVCGVHNLPMEDDVADVNGHGSNIVVHVLSCISALVKNSITLERIGGVLGNAAVFALGMVAFVQLQKVAFLEQTSAVGCRGVVESVIIFVLSPQEKTVQEGIWKCHLLEVNGSSG